MRGGGGDLCCVERGGGEGGGSGSQTLHGPGMCPMHQHGAVSSVHRRERHCIIVAMQAIDAGKDRSTCQHLLCQQALFLEASRVHHLARRLAGTLELASSVSIRTCIANDPDALQACNRLCKAYRL